MTSDFKHPMAWHDEPEAEGVFLGGADSGNLNLLDIPAGVMPREMPSVDRELIAARPVVQDLLAQVQQAVATARSGSPAQRLALDHLEDAEIALVDEILGQGEVSITAGFDPEYQVRESVMAGLWRVRMADGTGSLVANWLEVGPIPGFVREAARGLTAPALELPDRVPEGCMNVGPVLAEIRDRAASWRPGQRNHVLNFTLLPMTPEDTEFLTKALGRAPLTLISGGYGTARVHLTGIRNVWAVQFLNAMDKVILDTIEIGDVPGAVTAASEDFEDSATRLAEMMEVYFR